MNLKSKIPENPSVVYGRLMESAHIAGYTLERACGELEWLLEDDRWRQVATDINSLLATISWRDFKVTVEQRKKIAQRLSELQASQRATAKMLGVHHSTIADDLTNGGNPPDRAKKVSGINPKIDQSGGNPPPAWFQSETNPAKAIIGEFKKGECQDKKEEERGQAVERGKNSKAITGLKFIHADFRDVNDEIDDASIDLIFTDPPYDKAASSLWANLGFFAKRTLKPGGILMAYSGQMHLDQVFSGLGSHLTYYWTIAVLHTHGQLRLWKYRTWNSWKPILIWTNGEPKHEWFQDVMKVGDATTKDLHDWAQPTDQAKVLIKHFAPRDGYVVDPMCGSGTIPLAAHELGRRAMGIEKEEKSYLIAKGRANGWAGTTAQS